MQDIKSILRNLSHHPGVYQMLDSKGEVIYVGKAKDLKKRVSSYFSASAKDPKTTSLVKQIKSISVTITSNENEAVLLECNLIKKYRPRYNILLRDDKSYPYIVITTQHTYPRIDLYRGTRKKNASYYGPFPSSLAVRETINLLQKLFKLRTCDDSFFSTRSRPCLLYQIERCSGPCVGSISKEAYKNQIRLATLFLQGKSHELIDMLQVKMELASDEQDYELAANYRDQITRLRQIQDRQYITVEKGNADVIGHHVESGMVCIQLLSIRGGKIQGSTPFYANAPAHSKGSEIISAFITQHYLTESSHIESIPRELIVEVSLPDKDLLENVLSEQVNHSAKIIHPLRGERKKWITMAAISAKQSLALRLFSQSQIEQRIIALQEAIDLNMKPSRIECFDISHSMGEATVASCVVFDESGPVKNDYRRFNISDITPGDDVAAMKQVLLRRFKRLQKENTNLPELILIDGGTTQLNAAHEVLGELGCHEINIVGVSKGPGRKPGFETLHRVGKKPLHLPADSIALHFIQQIRDEAHRFAITGHRNQRDKARRKSTLEDIPGIGAKRRRDLLRYFGGIQGVAHASLDELMKVPGINKSLAERIFATLHDATN